LFPPSPAFTGDAIRCFAPDRLRTQKPKLANSQKVAR
jgi:hypothetical protein